MTGADVVTSYEQNAVKVHCGENDTTTHEDAAQGTKAIYRLSIYFLLSSYVRYDRIVVSILLLRLCLPMKN